MRAFWALWRKELAAYFLSPIAYVVVMFFLILMGISVSFLIDMLAGGTYSGTIMRVLFGESIFFWVGMLIAVPVITMRLLSEEIRSGTMEGLLTAPIRDCTVVLAKYFGALTFFVIMWLPTLAYAFIIRHFDPNMSVDLGPMFTGFLGALLVGSSFLALGLLASALTRNQVVAAIITFALTGVFFFSGFLPYVTISPAVRNTAAYFSPILHMMDFSRGVIDTRPLVLYVSITALLLFVAVRVVESGKWK